MPKNRDILSNEDIASIQQPLDYKTGRSNPLFDKLYPDTPNPWHGTERDIRLKKSVIAFNEKYAQGWERIFGKK
jgi:hypothetical protein